MKEDIRKYIEASERVSRETFESSLMIEAISFAAEIMIEALKAGKKIISCGNGGSACDASHFASELTGKYRDVREPLPAIALSDVAAMSCIGNDFGYAAVFTRQIKALGNEGDVLLAISTSGKSENVIWGMDAAYRKKMKIIGLTGANPSSDFTDRCDVVIRVTSLQANFCQEQHIKIIHCLVELIELEIK